MKSPRSIKKKVYLFWVILLAIFFIGGYYYNAYQAKTSLTNNEQDTADTTVMNAFSDMNTSLLASIQEKDFVIFAETSIESRCPFYKPDGVTYRGCLGDWEQDLESKALVEQVDEVHAYCSTFTKKYADEESLEGQELFLKCAIFKLQ